MKLPPLTEAILLKRYKRFLADVRLPTGEKITAHCPNTGAMTGCAEPQSRVWLSRSDNPGRKYPYGWELVETLRGDKVCIHSAKANDLVREAIEKGAIAPLNGYQSVRSEVQYGQEGSRIDVLLEKPGEQCYVEIKSVTLLLAEGLGVFPDTVSTRGRKHLRELMAMVEQGHRAVLLFCVLHTGIERVAPADAIDQQYAEVFRQALAAGVEVLAYHVDISVYSMVLQQPLTVLTRQPKT